ncbi:DinB family protein [Deltaproteobacteria bacterium OttesenSCG-928-M10]|nr:DinB family protein [Deltaproteobacteria bacterium OttesenSCG-928-M10]
MSRATVDALKGPIDQSFSLISQFIDVCPDNIWAEKSGGWPVWQQIYHSLGAVDFFVGSPGEAGSPPLVSADEAGLRKVSESTVGKADIKSACQAAKEKVDRYAAGLSDADLVKRNDGLFERAQMDMSHAATLSLLAAHALYHLGSCDAALRNHGLEGVF